jgi:hypothetical protein
MSPSQMQQKKFVMLTAISIIWLGFAALYASTGYYSLDELIYGAMIERFATNGVLTIPNGYEGHPSSALLLRFLIPGPDGLVPQYPAGYAVLAAPFFLIGGIQGVIFLNAIASVLTLIVAYGMTMTLFNNAKLAANATLILGFATFLGDYAFGIWPHAVSVLFVVSAAYCTVLSGRSNSHAGPLFAALGGLLVGLGLTMRVDVVIAAPALAAWLVGTSRRPAISTGAFALGIVPGLFVSAWLNHLKFGTWSPLSYGYSKGAASLQGYMPLLPYAVIGGAIVISFAFPRVRRAFLGVRGLLIVATGLAALLLLPWTQPMILRILRGYYVLIVDLQSYDYVSHSIGIIRMEDGLVLFWGSLKESLGQSMPYLGFAVLPAARLFQPERRSAYVLCILFPAIWYAPFAWTQWHGGLSNNLRYFTPTLPFLAILAASAWNDIRQQANAKPSWLLSIVVFMAVPIMVTTALAKMNSENYFFAVQIVIPSMIFITSATIALAWVLAADKHETLKRPASLIFVVGLVWAFLASAMIDPAISQSRRDSVRASHELFSNLEDNSLVYAIEPERFPWQLRRPAATLGILLHDVDYTLIDTALRQDRPVYAHTSFVADAIKSGTDGSRYHVTQLSDDPDGLYSVKHAGRRN